MKTHTQLVQMVTQLEATVDQTNAQLGAMRLSIDALSLIHI